MSETQNAALAALASNLVADEDAPVEAVVEKRIKIILEENDNIPPTGQFFGVQGKGYILRPGEVADVPMSIIGILNTAVQSVPILDQGQRVTGYRDKLRFPYRVMSDMRSA